MAGNAAAHRHARSRTRNQATFQLCQPTMPKSRVVGVTGVRVLAVAHRPSHCPKQFVYVTILPDSFNILEFISEFAFYHQ